MSGFERSAPVQGSQGPRRSQMVRHNNAPPPMSPWRQEVLEAQKQMQGSLKGEKRERSRSRSHRRKPDKAMPDKAADEASRSLSASKGAKAAMLPPEKAPLLRKAKDRGEGWHAASEWESTGASEKLRSECSSKKLTSASLQEKPKEKVKDKDRHKDGLAKAPEDESASSKQQALERKRQDETEARERKVAEERKMVEEQRKKREEMEKQRKQKLAGAFAVEDDDDDEGQREAERMRKAAERKRESLEVVPRLLHSVVGSASGASTTRSSLPSAREDLLSEPGLTAAEAFMRLQERKRKGRRGEYDGPPRGTSPRRDGRRPQSPRRK